MKKILYIPLDDRPISVKRVELLAKASGFSIVIPDLELVRTTLDHQPLTKYHKQCGDTQELLKWYSKLNHNDFDYYIISIDQISSGGLVNSRSTRNLSISDTITIIDSFLRPIIENNKKAILIDSIMRLASTIGYLSYTDEEYGSFRKYAKIKRLEASSFDEIISNYELDEFGNDIDYASCNLTIDKKNEYLLSRERKIKISKHLVELANQYSNLIIFLGIDDSSSEASIQGNEINYFKKFENDNYIIIEGIDELALCAVARVSQTEHLQDYVRLHINYIGHNEHVCGDSYQSMTIDECVKKHLKAVNAVSVEENPQIELVCLTYKEDECGSVDPVVDELIACINHYQRLNKPTILIDLFNWNRYGPLESRLAKEVNLSKLLGYSNWNTISNVIGIGIAIGVSYYSYLSSDHQYDENCILNFIKLHTFSLIKDISFKIFAHKYIKNKINDDANNPKSNLNFYMDLEKLDLDKITKEIIFDNNISKIDDIINNLCQHGFYKSLSDDSFKISSIVIDNFTYPWYRTFEMDFTVQLKK